MMLVARATRHTYDPQSPYKFSIFSVGGLEPIEFCRNVIVQQFLATDATRLWMVDDDMTPAANAFDLLKTDGDIVAGRFYRFAHASEAGPTNIDLCAFTRDSHNLHLPIDGADGPIEVDSVGTGSTVVRREVLTDPRMVGETTFDTLEGPKGQLGPGLPQPIFRRRYAPNGQVILGADLDFCTRAKGLGYSVVYDPAVEFAQINKINITEVKGLVERQVGVARYLASDGGVSALKALRGSWGNNEYAPSVDFLARLQDMANAAVGPVLECGSGLSTIVLAKEAERWPNLSVTTLEHSLGWYKAVRAALPDLPNHRIHRAPLRQYTDDLRWYDLSGIERQEDFSLIVCDGPQGTNNRYPLMPMLQGHLASGYSILVDDANRDAVNLKRWAEEFNTVTTTVTTEDHGIAIVRAA